MTECTETPKDLPLGYVRFLDAVAPLEKYPEEKNFVEELKSQAHANYYADGGGEHY